VNEFEYRSELTIRPKFPAKKGLELKRVLLDNLVAEKIFAIEAGGRNELANNKRFKAFIRGIQEQTMREELYRSVAENKVKLDTNEVKERYKLSGREYDVAFYTIHKEELARQIQDRILSNPRAAGEVFDDIGGGNKVPRHAVAWKDPEHDRVHEALFSRPVPVDTVIGPIKIDKNLYMLMKVMNWKDHPIIGGEEMQLRWNEVSQKARDIKARGLWLQYLQNLMVGKRIEFNTPVFKKLAELSYLMYTARADSERQEITQRFFGKGKDASMLDMYGDEESLKQAVFFSVDGKAWTVQDFQDVLESHPLVYRNKTVSKEEYTQEFKNAIADLVRDHFLTREAYKKSLHKNTDVKRNTAWWQDAMIAEYQRDQVLKQLAERFQTKGDSRLLTRRYEAYTDSLMAAYSPKTQIDLSELERVPLTTIDMVAYKPGVPYPMAVPGFTLFLTKP
jgi:hypothetical protein